MDDENNKDAALDDFFDDGAAKSDDGAAKGDGKSTEEEGMTATENAPGLDEFLAEDKPDEPEGGKKNSEGGLDYEEEDRRERVKLFTRLGIGLAALIVLAVGGFFGFRAYQNYSVSYCLTFEGKKVSVEDFKLLTLMLEDGSNGEDAVIDWLVDLCVFLKAADDYNLVLSADDVIAVEDYVAYVKEALAEVEDAPKISDKRLKEILSRNYYAQQLFDVLKADVVLNEDAAFESEFVNYRDNYRYDYVDIDFQYIYNESETALDDALIAMTKEGLDFDQAAVQYSEYHDEENQKSYVLTISDLTQMGFDAATVNSFIDMELGQISEHIDLGGAWVMFRTIKKDVPTESEVREVFTALYLENLQYNMFDEWIAGARESANFKINQKGIDKLNK